MTRRVRFSSFLAGGVFAAAVLGATRESGAVDVPFVTQPPLTTNANVVRSVFVADLDGDGDMDVASASRDDNKIAWYENVGGIGSIWTTHTITTAASGAYAVFAADVDGDGDTDLVAGAFYGGTLSWYENVNGDASVWLPHTVSTTAFGLLSVTVADVDGDGDLDIIAANHDASETAWYENASGSGSLWTPHTIALTLGADSVFAADVDADGDLDVLSASFNSSWIQWHENAAGDGSAWTPHTIATDTTVAIPRGVAAADVDGDGDIDAISISYSFHGLNWYENTTGDGSAWTLHTITGPLGGLAVSVADVDGDGDIDIVSSGPSSDMTLAWYENASGDGSAWVVHAIVVDPSFSPVAAIVAADLDADGDLDVIAAVPFDNRVAWYRNETIHSSACFTNQATIASIAGARWVFPADLDGDGDVDAISTSLSGSTLEWHENAAGNGSLWMTHTISTSPDGAYSAFAADVDGDGDLDVLSTAFLDRVFWHENVAGNGSVWALHTITTAVDAPVSVFGADVDGDGDIDAVSASQFDDTVAWYENVGGPGLTWIPHTITTAAQSASSVFAADVDGDGDMDVLSASYADNKVAWYENTAGNGTAWTTHTITTTAVFADSVFAADVDGDGDVDALSASANDGKIAWYENLAGNGSAWITHTITNTAADTPFFVYAADMDGDGDVDALSASIGPVGSVQWYENLAGNGSIWTVHTVSVSADGAASVCAADVDGDGAEDVISALYFDNTVAWHPNHAGQFSLAATDTAPATANNGDLVSMLRLDATHLGRAGDHDLELGSLGLLFEETAGDPLTSAEANALVESLRVYRDANGNGVFEPAADVLVTSLPTLNLVAGVQTVTLTDGDANVQVSFGSPRTYFVVVELTANASQQSPDQLRVTHLGLGPSASIAEDRDFDIPLRPACPADVSSSIRQAVPVGLLGFDVE